MKKYTLQKRKINLGPLAITLPTITFGQGPKMVGLVLGVHGVETTGLFLLQKLVEKESELKNEVRVISSANPSGLLLASRLGELDLPVNIKDPNRSFPGKINGSVQERVSAAVLEIISDCDFVLDIHNFSNLGQTFPILSLEGIDNSQGASVETLNFLKSLGMDFAFLIDTKQAERREFSGTLNEALNKEGIPNLSLELPPIEFLAESDLEILAGKVIRAINNIGKRANHEVKLPKLINTEIVRSERVGIFTPALKPPKEVKKGEVLGTIFDPFNLETIKIKSPRDGLLVVLKRKDFVRVGEFLFEIVREVKPKIVYKT